jgi:hypothetical protein
MAAYEVGLDLTVAVEPHEAMAYARKHPFPLLMLPASNQGLSFSCNAILTDARAKGHEWIWLIDDDVYQFNRVVNRRCVRADMRSVLLEAQGHATPGVGQVALEHRQVAWCASQAARRNGYCDVCVGIHVPTAPAYRPGMKQDRDFTMQIIASGRNTVRVCNLAFSTPAMGTSKGGLAGDYASDKDRQAAELLTARWPWCCKVIRKPNGRIDAKIDWKNIRRTT